MECGGDTGRRIAGPDLDDLELSVAGAYLYWWWENAAGNSRTPAAATLLPQPTLHAQSQLIL